MGARATKASKASHIQQIEISHSLYVARVMHKAVFWRLSKVPYILTCELECICQASAILRECCQNRVFNNCNFKDF